MVYATEDDLLAYFGISELWQMKYAVAGLAMRSERRGSRGVRVTDVRLGSMGGVVTMEIGETSPEILIGAQVGIGEDGKAYAFGYLPPEKKEETKKMEKKPKKKVKLAARDHLTQAIQKEYSSDKLAPSVITAWLDPSKTFGGTKAGFYASIVRYPNGASSVHNVVAKTSGHESCDAAIKALAKEWLGISAPKDALRAAVGL